MLGGQRFLVAVPQEIGNWDTLTNEEKDAICDKMADDMQRQLKAGPYKEKPS